MPARQTKPCKHRGCGALVADGKTHCDQHAHKAVKWKPDTVRGNWSSPPETPDIASHLN